MAIFLPTAVCVVFWAILMAVLIYIEANTANLVTIWFAVGALASMLASLFTQNILYQALIFAVVSALALAFSKPFIDKARHRKPTSPVGLDRDIGRRATVLSAIVPGHPGRVRLDGVDWSAVCDQPLEPGESCIVTAINSTTLVVNPVSAENKQVIIH